MILLDLFLTFLMIGAVSFGGGYGMIPLIRDEVLSNGWLTEERFLDLVAVSESTPGPIAVNMATFIGSSQAGILGSLFATLGVILPSFVVILLVAAVLRNLMKYRGVQAALSGIRPVIAGLICATGLSMVLAQTLHLKTIAGGLSFDWRQTLILAAAAAAAYLWKRVRGERVSPILLILLSAGLGVLLYGIVP